MRAISSNFFRLLITTVVLYNSSHAQVPGQWTFMKGSDTLNFVGHYGTRGIPDTNDMPPGFYEAVEWTDLNGNFWLYGGESFVRFGVSLWASADRG